MKKVLINISFKDKYSGELFVAGATTEMTEERIDEIKEVNSDFVTIIDDVEKPVAVEKFTAEETSVIVSLQKPQKAKNKMN